MCNFDDCPERLAEIRPDHVANRIEGPSRATFMGDRSFPTTSDGGTPEEVFGRDLTAEEQEELEATGQLYGVTFDCGDIAPEEAQLEVPYPRPGHEECLGVHRGADLEHYDCDGNMI